MLARLLAYATQPGQTAYGGVPRSPKWAGVRAGHLKQFPACAACGSRKCVEVHHVVPVSWPGGKELELDPANLLTLCESKTMNCHLWIGHLGDFRSRNPNAVADAAAVLAKVRGRPYPGRLGR